MKRPLKDSNLHAFRHISFQDYALITVWVSDHYIQWDYLYLQKVFKQIMFSCRIHYTSRCAHIVAFYCRIFLEGCFSFIPANYSTLIIPSTLPSSKGLQTTVQNPINTSKPCETYQWPYYWQLNYGIRQLSSTVGTDFRFIQISILTNFLFSSNNSSFNWCKQI